MIYDLHIDAKPPHPRLLHLLAAIFDVEPQDVRLLQTHEELTGMADVSVACIVVPRLGDFALSLEVIVRDPADLSEEEVASHVARHLQCTCLITDDAVDPYSWTLVTQDGEHLHADVDPDALDRDEFRVVRVRRTGDAV